MNRKWWLYSAVALIAAGLAACEVNETEREAPADAEPETEAEAIEATDPGIVEVEAGDFYFEAPDEIPSGWTTFHMENTGQQEHFLVLWPLPEDRIYDEFKETVLAPFHDLLPRYDNDEMSREEFMENLGVALPEWAFEAFQGAGGPAMTAPGMTAETTVYLEPGEYVIECYVRAPEGQVHNMLGMVAPLTVTAEESGAAEPQADRVIDVYNDRIEIDGLFVAGRHTIQVNYREQPEGLLTHDLNLARLDDDSDIDEVVAWLDWVDGMRAPAPVTFLGGVEHMPAGSTGYMKVTLEPGRYLWVSEAYGGDGVLREFVIE